MKQHETNEQRAEWAREVVLKFRALVAPKSGEEEATLTRDLIVDLMHLLRAQGADPIRTLEVQIGVFLSEEQDPGNAGPEPDVSIWYEWND